MDITTNKPTARCLDLSRLVSRIGRGRLTGIDRVEMAYLAHLLDDNVPLFALINLGRYQVVLDQAGAREIHRKLSGAEPWRPVKSWSYLFPPRARLRKSALSEIYGVSVGAAHQNKLGQLLKKTLPAGTSFINVGHSNLAENTFAAMKGLKDAKVAVMIHDTIPLDFPEFQRPGTPAKFEAKVRLVGGNADLVIYNSQASHCATDRHFSEWGVSVPSLVAHLGLDITDPDQQALPNQVDLKRPYFVTIGTIEPRKNHALLLDIWDNFRRQGKHHQLVIAGARGWNNKDVFDRLNRRVHGVCELNDLSDGGMSALLKGSSGLLFPSLAEGFGLPPAEAAALNVPVVCADLDVYREFLGDYPTYLDANDMPQWEMAIEELAIRKNNVHNGWNSDEMSIKLPSWESHFNIVLNAI